MRAVILAIAAVAISAGSATLRAAEPGESLTITKLAVPFTPDEKPFCVSLTEDEKLIVFQADRPGGYGKQDLWFSRFENGRWSAVYNAGPEINTAADDVDGKLSPDGSSLLFIRVDAARTSSQIYISHLRNGKWSRAELIGPPVTLPGAIHFGALLSRDGKRLYFATERPGGHGGRDIYYSDKAGDKWSEPVNLGPVINTAGNDGDQALGRDGNTMVIPGRRENSIGGTDLYITRRVNNAWSPPENLGPRINTPGNESCPWLGYNGRTLYFNSDWDGLVGGGKGPRMVWKVEYSKGF